MFQHLPSHSPVSQDLIWVAEYADGTHLAEFDLSTHEENWFRDIEKEKLIEFGLIGCGHKMYFEVIGGRFHMTGRTIAFEYKIGEISYPLSGLWESYSDIISYKDAASTLNPNGGVANQITQYNFGYKKQLKINGVNVKFQAVCHLPYDAPIRFHFRLVSDSELNGQLVIVKDNWHTETFDAPLKENVGGELNWILN